MTTQQTYCTLRKAYTKIYTLSDIEGDVFYIGNTMHPLDVRLNNHLSEAKTSVENKSRRKNEVIRSLNYNVVISIIDVRYITGSNIQMLKNKAHKIEQEWVGKYLSLGYNLANMIVPRTEKPVSQQEEIIGFSLIASDGKITRASKQVTE